MADLLKSGAQMLQDHCPVCNSLLFKVKGEVRCPKCNKRVVTVKEGEESRLATSSLLDEVEKILLLKIQDSSRLIMEERDIAVLERLSNIVGRWIDMLENVRRMKLK